jgi:carboxymethylenebutenolidase
MYRLERTASLSLHHSEPYCCFTPDYWVNADQRMEKLLRWCLFAVLLVTAGCGGNSDTEYSDDLAEQHAEDTPEATAAARASIIPVDGSTVAYATTESGEAITGYLAEPERPDSVLEARGLDPSATNLPGLVVIHEWWGLNDNIRAATRRLAGEGYRALAVDLYRGATAETPEDAQALMQTAMKSPEDMRANLQAAVNYLHEEVNAPRVGVMGWCFGGGMALNAAVAQPETLDALVVYYGRVHDVERSELAALDMPLMGHFGEQDSSIPVENVASFEQTLNDLGKDVEMHMYPNAGHAFANPSGQNYNPDAAATAWDRTTRFLRDALYPESGSTTAADE